MKTFKEKFGTIKLTESSDFRTQIFEVLADLVKSPYVIETKSAIGLKIKSTIDLDGEKNYALYSTSYKDYVVVELVLGNTGVDSIRFTKSLSDEAKKEFISEMNSFFKLHSQYTDNFIKNQKDSASKAKSISSKLNRL